MQKILSYLRQCADDYHMIRANDRIAVGLSGGKDSLTLLAALRRMRDFYPIPYSLTAISVDLGFPGTDPSALRAFCEELEVPLHIVPTQIGEIVFSVRKEKNPCSLCAKLRYGALISTAQELSCGKVALGHHREDAVETFLLNQFFEGRVDCFAPVTYFPDKDISLIRPLLYIPERTVRGYARRAALPVRKNSCPADGHTKRQAVKEHLNALEKEQPGIKKRLFTALSRSGIEGWQREE